MGWRGLGRCKDEEGMMLEGRLAVSLFPNEAPVIPVWQPIPPPTTHTSTKEHIHMDTSHTTVGSASSSFTSAV